MSDESSIRDAGGTPLLDVRNASVHYKGARRGAKVAALDGVDLTIQRGRTVGLVGESGSGKSTLGRAILGLVPLSSGSITFDGKDITKRSVADSRQLSTRLQVVFQDPYGSLNPAKSIGATLSEPLRAQGIGASASRVRIMQALQEVGLPESTVSRYPAEFSGGQRQRIAIARALVLQPELIICDEAVSALDLSVQAQILNLLADLKKRLGVSYLFISHDLAVVRYISDDIMVLNKGRLVESGTADEVYSSPREDYTKRLLGAAPKPSEVARIFV